MKKSMIHAATPVMLLIFAIALKFPGAFIPLAIVSAIYLIACAGITWKLYKTGEIKKQELPHIVFILVGCVVMLVFENNIIEILDEMMSNP